MSLKKTLLGIPSGIDYKCLWVIRKTQLFAPVTFLMSRHWIFCWVKDIGAAKKYTDLPRLQRLIKEFPVHKNCILEGIEIMTEKKTTSTGHRSTGHRSTGHRSTGDYSTGHRSTGDFSTGYCSTGDYSTGHRSTGDFSTGDFSTGYCSTGDFSTGHFSTTDGKPSFFDKPFNGTWDEAANLIPYVELKLGTYWVDSSEMTDQQKADHPSHGTTGGVLLTYDHTYQEAWAIAWAEMDQETKDRFLNLPNFDAEKFKLITGIDTTPVPVQTNASKSPLDTMSDGEIIAEAKRRGLSV